MFFLWNTNKNNRNSVNTQNNTGDWGVGVLTMGQAVSEFFIFDSEKEGSNKVTTILNLRFINKQIPALSWHNITC